MSALDHFNDVPKQPKPTSTSLIRLAFPNEDPAAYKQLSRPAHGNAVWLTAVAIQEQKRTPFAAIYAMKNISFATRCLVTAITSAGELWSSDLNEITQRALAQFDIHTDWDQLAHKVSSQSRVLSLLNEGEHADTRPVPQPPR